MNKKFKLVICDIDGTIVKNDHVMTQRTKDAINKLHDKGILFGIASGRPIDEIADKAKLWGFEYEFDLLIGLNGCELRDGITNTDYEYYLLKKEWIKEIMDIMEPFDTNYFLYRNGALLCREVSEVMKNSAASCLKPVSACSDPSEMWEQENAKIMFRTDTAEELIEIENYFKENPTQNYSGFKTQSTLYEFADSRISKAYALERFCELQHMTLDDIIAFGDTTNDNEMLKASGLGVCLCNGSDDTKALADVITEYTNEEDGFAKYVETYLLND